jgi:hypothetical protein
MYYYWSMWINRNLRFDRYIDQACQSIYDVVFIISPNPRL